MPRVRPLIDAGYSVVVVDDGSSDGTWEEIQQLPVYALRHPINLGQGAALQTGMSFALKQGADYVVHFDADGQHRPVDIDVVLGPVLDGKVDVALGSRFLSPESAAAVPFRRRLFLRGATYVNYVLTGVLLSDAHNGLRALSRGRGPTHSVSRERIRARLRNPAPNPFARHGLRGTAHTVVYSRVFGRQGAVAVERV